MPGNEVISADAVVFDLFETLVPEFDIGHPDARAIATALGVDHDGFLAAYDASRPRRFTGRYADHAEVLRCILAQLGGVPAEPVIASLQAERLSAFSNLLARPSLPVLDALRELRRGGFRLALLSNTDGSEVAGWPSSPLSELIPVAVFSHQVGYVKPDRRAYQAVADALGVSTQACIFVGDGNSDELAGAAAAGMRPYCAAWFLREHVSHLGADVVSRRAGAFPVLKEPRDLISAVASVGRRAEAPS